MQVKFSYDKKLIRRYHRRLKTMPKEYRPEVKNRSFQKQDVWLNLDKEE
jgi:hypothetical protein